MSQIAEAAGVSIPTVSKVIHQRSDVAPETRERVERLLVEHGYLNAKATPGRRRGHKGHSGLVNLVVHHLNNAYELEIIRGVQQALADAGQGLVLSATHKHTHTEPIQLATAGNTAVDGVILILVDERTSYVQKLQKQRLPFVVIDRLGALGPDIPSVGATNWAGGRAATQHLLSLGHRRIGVIAGPISIACTYDRLAGYRTALEAAHIPFDPDLVRHGEFIPATGYAQTHSLLALPEPPTAIFASNDEQASGVYQALHERSIAVPEAMSVIGFDDTFIAPRLTPALTTIRQPLFEMGLVATSMLLRLVNGEALDSTRVELPTTLIQRNSCAPPHQQTGSTTKEG